MGQHASSSSSPPPNPPGTIDTEPKPTCQRHHIFPQSFKRLLVRCRCSKGNKLMKNDMKSFHHHHQNLIPNTNVILPTSTIPDPISRLFIALPSSSSSPRSKSKLSKHSLVSLALSKLAFFAQVSKERMGNKKVKVTCNPKQKLSFHKTTTKKKAKTKAKPENAASSSSQTEGKPDANNNKKMNSVNLLELSKYDAKLRQELIRKLLSPLTHAPQTPEEMYKLNLKRFERLLTITTASTDDDDDEDDDESVSEEGEVLKNWKSSGIGVHKKNRLPRIISTSKNRVEIDVHFMDWIKSRLSSKSEQDSNGNPNKEGRPSETATGKQTSPGRNAKSIGERSGGSSGRRLRSTATTRATTNKLSLAVSDGRKSKLSKATSGKTDKSSLSKATATTRATANKTSLAVSGGQKSKLSEATSGKTDKSSWSKSTATKSYYSVAVGQTLVESYSDDSSPDENNNLTSSKGQSAKSGSERPVYRETWNSLGQTFVKRGCCAGKGSRAEGRGGPPPVYLDYGGGAGCGSGARRRAQQDPVMERLKNVDVVEELTYMVPNPCGNESDDCEYYAVCDSCGEMEPLPEELKKKISKKGNKEDTTPVTYSRRQRFNFKQKNEEEDEDGPPFRYEGQQCPSCRCSCCVAGLRRNPNCQCKCCQAMGTLRRCNSFDETPVGKNPIIRRIPCPEEICKEKLEKCMKEMPGASGMYKFDKKERGFALQVPRTPTPIILEVPVPRRLGKNELQSMAKGIARKKLGVQCPAPAPPVEAEPIVLPPIYGQCNPCCNPCYFGPNQQNPGATKATTAKGKPVGAAGDKSAGVQSAGAKSAGGSYTTGYSQQSEGSGSTDTGTNENSQRKSSSSASLPSG